MDICGDIIHNERLIKEYVRSLTAHSPAQAECFCVELLEKNADKISASRAVSAAYARCVCTFLLDKKNKSMLTEIIKNNKIIREAFFGRLDTYKYSIVFVLKRILKLNDTELTKEVLRLICNNPFRDDSAKSYSDRWSLKFITDEVMKAPEDYLNLSEESMAILNQYL
ncbi:MAG: hypothetical protein GX824_00715 [Clostridiales bacterium]|jgi:hypothetical protein|nr:hypothetical protein [Clostridiales bacterium]